MGVGSDVVGNVRVIGGGGLQIGSGLQGHPYLLPVQMGFPPLKAPLHPLAEHESTAPQVFYKV